MRPARGSSGSRASTATSSPSAPRSIAAGAPIRSPSGSRIAFIKCDVEGHEAVLGGAAETLERSRPAVLVEVEERHHHRPLDEVLTDVVPDGYAAWAVPRDGLRPAEELDLERDHRAPLREAGNATPGPAYVNDFLLRPSASG